MEKHTKKAENKYHDDGTEILFYCFKDIDYLIIATGEANHIDMFYHPEVVGNVTLNKQKKLVTLVLLVCVVTPVIINKFVVFELK